MEWVQEGEWVQGVVDPNSLVHPITQVIPSMADRYNRCGCISVEGYWREPPKALRGVQLYLSLLSQCRKRLAERINGGK